MGLWCKPQYYPLHFPLPFNITYSRHSSVNHWCTVCTHTLLLFIRFNSIYLLLKKKSEQQQNILIQPCLVTLSITVLSMEQIHFFHNEPLLVFPFLNISILLTVAKWSSGCVTTRLHNIQWIRRTSAHKPVNVKNNLKNHWSLRRGTIFSFQNLILCIFKSKILQFFRH